MKLCDGLQEFQKLLAILYKSKNSSMPVTKYLKGKQAWRHVSVVPLIGNSRSRHKPKRPKIQLLCLQLDVDISNSKNANWNVFSG